MADGMTAPFDGVARLPERGQALLQADLWRRRSARQSERNDEWPPFGDNASQALKERRQKTP